MIITNLFKNFTVIVISILAISISGCKKDNNTQVESIAKPAVIYAGARASSYGFNEFPSAPEFGRIATNIANEVNEIAVPSSVWIVSVIGNDGKSYLEFPNASGKNYNNIVFSDIDKHEAYLNYFDSIGVKVFLQVEAGLANMEDLITLVLSRYKNHPSVVGFGIDVEWFPSNGQEANGVDGGTKLTNADLIRYDTLVKKFNPKFRIFVKHWKAEYCGNGPVSDVIYIDDSQELESLDAMAEEFSAWGKAFYPNDVGFQVGYASDYSWWGSLNNPIKDISTTLSDKMNNQTVHFYWVDFTLDYGELQYVH